MFLEKNFFENIFQKKNFFLLWGEISLIRLTLFIFRSINSQTLPSVDGLMNCMASSLLFTSCGVTCYVERWLALVRHVRRSVEKQVQILKAGTIPGVNYQLCRMI